ncbi:hypothetical protein [Streptosporangium sp. NPDC023615]|uniref:hypothetical protein n=1 Tax=Streptosporangium sp. NPDC023615 TaxID=3154794 RepID=UPI003431F6E0
MAAADLEQGEFTFAEATQGTQKPVAGVVAGAEDAVSPGLFDRGADTDSGVVVGEGGAACGGGVQRTQDVDAGDGQVMDREDLGAFVNVAVGGGAREKRWSRPSSQTSRSPRDRRSTMTTWRNGVRARFPAGGGAQAAFVVQESGEVVNERETDVERGTTSDHVKPSGRSGFL